MFFVFISVSSCLSPPIGAGGVMGISATSTVAQNCGIFFFLFGGMFSPRPLSLRLWRYFGFRSSVDRVVAPPPPL